MSGNLIYIIKTHIKNIVWCNISELKKKIFQSLCVKLSIIKCIKTSAKVVGFNEIYIIKETF